MLKFVFRKTATASVATKAKPKYNFSLDRLLADQASKVESDEEDLLNDSLEHKSKGISPKKSIN
jgi:hypothetical protein